jgi:hypothetical protein
MLMHQVILLYELLGLIMPDKYDRLVPMVGPVCSHIISVSRQALWY